MTFDVRNVYSDKTQQFQDGPNLAAQLLAAYPFLSHYTKDGIPSGMELLRILGSQQAYLVTTAA